MKTRATGILMVLALMSTAFPASAQVTIRDVNALAQENINNLEGPGAALTREQIVANVTNALVGSEITFTAVVLTDPLSSGLANLGNGTDPDRIHVFVRDVNAATLGNEGMGVQLVDAAYATSGLLNTTVGDVIEVTGTVAPFVGSTGISMQVSPTSITLLGDYVSLNYPASIIDPVAVTSADVNKRVDASGGQQVNWTNLPDLNGQFVRLENARVMVRDISTSRPNFLVSTDNGETIVNFYDTSIRFRNDRGDYPASFNKRPSNSPFVPPPPGAVINLQGFLMFQGDDPFTRGVPPGQILSINPFADADLEIVESPPQVANLSRPNFVPGAAPVAVTATVSIDPARTVGTVELRYYTSDDATVRTAAGTDTGGGVYSFSVPSQADGVFVTYWVYGTDNTGAESVHQDPIASYRVLTGGIQDVAHIQETASGGVGDSPFAGLTTDMDLTVTVMSNPSGSNLVFVQDDPDLAPWSGLEIRTRPAVSGLNAGDVIHITNALIQENFGVTRLDNVIFTTVSTGGSTYGYKTMTTGALKDLAVAEAHEGMALKFSLVTITATNSDAPGGPFGEFSISSDGTAANALRVDDASGPIAYTGGDPGAIYSQGQVLAFVRGFLSYTFSNFKLFPETFDDISTDPEGTTIRDVNALAQENVNNLEGPGAALTREQIVANVTNALVGTEITFTAVVLTDPLSSGLANLGNGTDPDRIHVFVRDVNAAWFGKEGMGVQLVDAAYATSGLLNTTVGDVIEVTGTVAPFVGSTGISMQVSPTSITLLGDYVSLDYPASIIDPVVVTSADVNKRVDASGGQQVNWTNLPDLNGQFVRLENARVMVRDISTSRPNFLVSTDNGETIVNFYDTSIRFRNDRGDYPASFNKRPSNSPFVPPPPGAVINLQGFLMFQGDDPFTRGVPPGQILSINPFADADLEIVESPPQVANLSRPDHVPGAAPVTVTATVSIDPARTASTVNLVYFTSLDATLRLASGIDTGGGVYSFDIPAQPDDTFVTYWVEAIDNTGATSVYQDPMASYRVLVGGIQTVAHIQETPTGGAGNSPFAGLTTDMDLTVTVASNPSESGLVFVQDDAGLAPWSGLEIRTRPAVSGLNAGDVIHITNALIQENFGVTRLDNVTFTTVSTGGSTLGYKTMTTGALRDLAVAEAHEGMALRFENVTITATNSDVPAGPFGEFSISSDGTAASALRVDDASSQITYTGGDPGVIFSQGQTFAYVQGHLSYTFSNFKLFPGTFADIGGTGVAVEDETVPDAFALRQNYPNPFNPVTTIGYDVASTESVRIEVFDLLGRRVALLVDGMQAPGRYTVTFDGRGLGSGTYLYRMQAAGRVFTDKMLLLK